VVVVMVVVVCSDGDRWLQLLLLITCKDGCSSVREWLKLPEWGVAVLLVS